MPYSRRPASDALFIAPLSSTHGISRLRDIEGDKPAKKKFKSYPIGYFHIDIAEVRTEQGKLHMFVAIDRTSKFAFVELHEKARTVISKEFLLRLIAAVPYKIHTVLTDNGIQFTTPGAGGSAVPLIKEAVANGEIFRAHAFEYAFAKNDIEHRTTKPKHPWTNGQVERMNRTIKDATVKRFHYDDHDQLRRHLADFVAAYNFGRRLKTLKGFTPYEFICKAWGFPARALQSQYAPANAGTKQLSADGISVRDIATMLGIARSTVQDNIERATAAGLFLAVAGGAD